MGGGGGMGMNQGPGNGMIMNQGPGGMGMSPSNVGQAVFGQVPGQGMGQPGPEYDQAYGHGYGQEQDGYGGYDQYYDAPYESRKKSQTASAGKPSAPGPWSAQARRQAALVAVIVLIMLWYVAPRLARSVPQIVDAATGKFNGIGLIVLAAMCGVTHLLADGFVVSRVLALFAR